MHHHHQTGIAEKDGLPSEHVSALLEDGKGRLWVGTEGGALARSEGDRFVRETSRDALGSQIRALLENDQGLWIATDAGLARLRDGDSARTHLRRGFRVGASARSSRARMAASGSEPTLA